MLGLYLIVGVLVVGCAVALAFHQGERRRRVASGHLGPPPAPSIGEALRRVDPLRGRVLVVFLCDDGPSAEVGRVLAEDPALHAALGKGPLQYVVVRSAEDDLEVAGHLYEKYAEEALPRGPAALLLDPQGACLARATPAEGGATEAGWLLDLVSRTGLGSPPRGRTGGE